MADLSTNSLPQHQVRIVSLVEASTVTGPMKPLLMFARNMQAQRNARAEISHSVITTIRNSGTQPLEPTNFMRAADAAGVPVTGIRERFLFDWSILPQLAHRLAAMTPNIVETHDFKSHFLMWLLKKTRRMPEAYWIAFHHGYTRMSTRVRMYQHLDRLSLPAADQVVTVCAPFKVELTHRGVDPARITILSNAIETRDRAPAAQLLRVKEQIGLRSIDRVIVSVGRLSVEKGHAVLISAFQRLRTRIHPQEARLVIVGDGGEAKNLKRLAAELGESIIFTGHVEDPWPYYCLADVFALPSYSEGSPLAIFEAMTAGAPIVASSVGGVPETLSNERSAILVQPGAVAELADALERVLRDSDLALRLSQNAYDNAKQFTPTRYIGERLAIYESLLAMNRDPSNVARS